jgi:hypothetical protein
LTEFEDYLALQVVNEGEDVVSEYSEEDVEELSQEEKYSEDHNRDWEDHAEAPSPGGGHEGSESSARVVRGRKYSLSSTSSSDSPLRHPARRPRRTSYASERSSPSRRVTEPEEELGSSSPDMVEALIDKFPSQDLRLKRRFDALKQLAKHRYGSVKGDPIYATTKEKDKGRFRRAYTSIIEDERRQDRIRNQRRQLLSKLEQRRKQHEERVERIRMQRLAEQLAKESESRRQRRTRREDALVKMMFEDALASERERVLRLSKAASEDRLRQDRDALARYEATRKVYEDQKDILEETLRKKEQAEKTQERMRKHELRRMARDLKQDFERKLQDARTVLEAREERLFTVNAETIERAFTILNDTRAGIYQANIVARA